MSGETKKCSTCKKIKPIHEFKGQELKARQCYTCHQAYKKSGHALSRIDWNKRILRQLRKDLPRDS